MVKELWQRRESTLSRTQTHTSDDGLVGSISRRERKKRENENDCKDKSKSEVSAVYLLMQISAPLLVPLITLEYNDDDDDDDTVRR